MERFNKQLAVSLFPDFSFVKAVDECLVKTAGVDWDYKTMKHLTGQGPIYTRVDTYILPSAVDEDVRDITKLSGYPHSNVKTRLEQSNYYLASGRFPLQNAIYDNKLPFSWM